MAGKKSFLVLLKLTGCLRLIGEKREREGATLWAWDRVPEVRKPLTLTRNNKNLIRKYFNVSTNFAIYFGTKYLKLKLNFQKNP